MLMALVLLTFVSVCRHDFVNWDDPETIQENPRITHPSPGNVWYYWRHPHMGLYVPVTYTVWSALAAVARVDGPDAPPGTLDAGVFHAASLVLHLLNVLLVYAILRRLLSREMSARSASLCGAAGALLFGLHPVQVETIAWASGMKDLLCATFTLAAVREYLRYARPDLKQGADGTASPARWRHYALGMAALLLAMLSKPTAMVTPLLLLVIDALVLRRPLRVVLRSVVPWFALVAPCLVWTKLIQPGTYLVQTPLWARPLVAADALAFYLYKLVWPTHLGLDYGRTPGAVIEHHWAFYTWLVPMAVLLALVVWRKRPAAGMLAAAGLLLVAGVAPVLGLTPFMFQSISTVADHYLYLAMLGPALAAAFLLGQRPWAAQSTGRRRRIVATLVLGWLAACSATQTTYWQDGETLFRHALEVNPRSGTACNNLASLAYGQGQALARAAGLAADRHQMRLAAEQHARAEARFREAYEMSARALELNPKNLAAWHSLAMLQLHFGQFPEAAATFAQVVVLRDRLSPEARASFYEDSDLLGTALMASGRTAEAVECLKAALRLNPAPEQAAKHLAAAEAILAAAHRPPEVLGPPAPAIADIHREAGPVTQ